VSPTIRRWGIPECHAFCTNVSLCTEAEPDSEPAPRGIAEAACEAIAKLAHARAGSKSNFLIIAILLNFWAVNDQSPNAVPNQVI
jgi:hypothetical protein